MAEFEVNASFSGEIDVEVDFSKYTDEELKEIIEKIKSKKKHIFRNVYIEIDDYETMVDIEPLYSHFP